ncbi:hypothetical protein H0H92_015385 [Tricholoma furcatifolium]|nr:hypothetical protein H0H92_015385 [Tricholoma furcatifolium]
MNFCQRLTAQTSLRASLARTYATRHPRPKPGTSERPPMRRVDPLLNNPQAVVTPLEDGELTFIHRPPPTAPSPFSLSTAPTSPLLRPLTPAVPGPLPPLMRKEMPNPERASDEAVAEIRRLRRSDPDTYTRLKLAKMFDVTPNFVGCIAALKPSGRKARKRIVQEQKELEMEGWSERKLTAHLIRKKRREFW